jgi:nicotinamide mononucleotide transporter
MTTSPLEAAAVLFGIVSVLLSIRQNIWSWPTAIGNATLYIFLFWQARLYANMGLQVAYIALSVYGWHKWLHGGGGRTALDVSRATSRLLVALVAIGTASSLAIAAVLTRYTDGSLPYVDSITTAANLIAQWMLARKILENWILWIAVDVVSVGMFLHKSLYLTALLYVVFLGLSATGYRRWRRSLGAAQVV